MQVFLTAHLPVFSQLLVCQPDLELPIRVLPRFGNDRSQFLLPAAQDTNVAKSWIIASAALSLTLPMLAHYEECCWTHYLYHAMIAICPQ